MDFLQPHNRNQVSMSSMDSMIAGDNEVRVIDAFVDALDMKQLGFSHTIYKSEGRPPFHCSVFLKLYLYGYMNRVRSSRRLEKECIRNIEVQWLLGELKPNYHSIADFRKDHGKAFRAVFKMFVLFLNESDLLGKTLVGIDGSKFRAVNSKKNNYNEKKVERHLTYIDNKAGEYLQQLEALDKEEEKSSERLIRKKDIKKKLSQLKERKVNYRQIQKQIEQSDDGQVSTTDTESKALIISKNIVEVSYNAQTAVDDKNNLIVHYEATNKNDSKALHKAALETKNILQVEKLTALADKGYHNGEQLAKCEKENITTVVAYREQPSVKHLEEKYLVENFQYNKEEDTYTCPQEHTLKSNGNWYKKNHKSGKRKTGGITQVKHYKTPHCKNCPVLNQCTKNTRGRGRVIERSQYQDYVDRNNERVKTQREIYNKRQAICEHPFGTIKRAWGYTYTLLKGLKKVDGEMGLIFTCYNLRRTISILGIEKLLEKLKIWKPDYKFILTSGRNPLFFSKTASLPRITDLQFFRFRLAA